MRCLHIRFLLTSVCFLLPFVATTSTSEAGIIPWAYDVIFGPNYGPNYGPRGYASYGPRYYYGPSVTYGSNYGWSGGGCCGTQAMAYRPAYGCCDPCPVACSPCGVTTQAAPGTPPNTLPNNSNPGPARSGSGAPKTFAEDPGGFTAPKNSSVPGTDSTATCVGTVRVTGASISRLPQIAMSPSWTSSSHASASPNAARNQN